MSFSVGWTLLNAIEIYGNLKRNKARYYAFLRYQLDWAKNWYMDIIQPYLRYPGKKSSFDIIGSLDYGHLQLKYTENARISKKIFLCAFLSFLLFFSENNAIIVLMPRKFCTKISYQITNWLNNGGDINKCHLV